MDDVTPIRDVSTCREKQDAAIENLREQVSDMREALHLLRLRVIGLEILNERVTRLESIMLLSVHPKRQTAPLQSEQLAAIHDLREVTP